MKATPFSQLICSVLFWTHIKVGRMEGLKTLTSSKMRVVKTIHHIKTTVVDLRRRRNPNNHCRVLERGIKLTYYKVRGQLAKNNQIKTAVEDLR